MNRLTEGALNIIKDFAQKKRDFSDWNYNDQNTYLDPLWANITPAEIQEFVKDSLTHIAKTKNYERVFSRMVCSGYHNHISRQIQAPVINDLVSLYLDNKKLPVDTLLTILEHNTYVDPDLLVRAIREIDFEPGYNNGTKDIRSANSWQGSKVLRNPSFPEKQMHSLVYLKYSGWFGTLAELIKDEKVLYRLAKLVNSQSSQYQTHWTLASIVKNRHVSAPMLEKIAQISEKCAAIVAGSRRTKAGFLDTLTKHPDVSVRASAARNTKTSDKELEALAEDNNVDVLLAVACNHTTPMQARLKAFAKLPNSMYWGWKKELLKDYAFSEALSNVVREKLGVQMVGE